MVRRRRSGEMMTMAVAVVLPKMLMKRQWGN
jgi:hypothetical protein